MKNIILFCLLLIIIAICISCSNSTTGSNSSYDLPNEFPLEEGNAWIYERVYYENGVQDTTILDTLYIAGRFEDYYLYTWSPEFHVSLVKNIDNKFVCFGYIDSYGSEIDTVFYDFPEIWAFYGETGQIDSTYYLNYSYTNIDSEYISILPDEEFFNKRYDTYRREITFSEVLFCKVMYQLTNKLGFVRWEFIDEDYNLTGTDEMIEKLEDFYPEEILTNKNQNTSKSLNQKRIYFQNGMFCYE